MRRSGIPIQEANSEAMPKLQVSHLYSILVTSFGFFSTAIAPSRSHLTMDNPSTHNLRPYLIEHLEWHTPQLVKGFGIPTSWWDTCRRDNDLSSGAAEHLELKTYFLCILITYTLLKGIIWKIGPQRCVKGPHFELISSIYNDAVRLDVKVLISSN